MTSTRLTLVSIVVGLAGLAVSAALTPEQVVDLRHVRSVAVAPGGRAVAYTLDVPRSPEAPPGKSWVELWVARDGAEPRPFVGGERRVSDVAWSPDGARISFVAASRADAEIATLWSIPADGGEAAPLLDPSGSISAHRWSPDGRLVAFTAKDPETEAETKDREAGRDWTVADESPRFERLWLLDVAAGTTRRLVERDLHVLDLDWAPDGGSLVVRATESPRVDDDYMGSKLWRVPLEGEPEPLLETPGKLGAPAFSPDGGRIAFLGATTRNDPLAQSLFVIEAGGAEARNLTRGVEWSAADFAWIDGRTILLVAVDEARQRLYRVDVTTGERQERAWPRLVADAIDVDAVSGRAAAAAEAPDHPPELFTFGARDETAPVRRTRTNPALEGVRLARQETITWRGAGGWKISGVLTWPLDHVEGKRYPLVLQVHGGPEGVSLDGFTTSALYPVQPLAAAGFFVLEPNYRGSQGRGVAFSKADHDDLGGAEYADVLAGIDHLVERGLVDGARVGTGGWSYGGYFSAWAATRHSERFKASIVAAGIADWISFAGTTDIPYEMSLVHWDSWWFDETELHWDRSPLAHLGRARTPTLIVHGAEDDRVHPQQSLELYTALRIKGVPTRYVSYPREPHGLDERAHRLDFIERCLDWFGRWLGPASDPAGTRP